MREARLLPLPGDVLVLSGGPPCQDLSGHNRTRQVTDIMRAPRNRLCLLMADAAALLRPDLVVLEQVEGALTLEGGRYVKTCLRKLLALGYQVRAGVIGVFTS